MSLLSVFPSPPSSGQVTLCESNAKLVAESVKTADLSKYINATQGLTNYPEISADPVGVKTAKSLLRSEDQKWSPFVPSEENIYKKLLATWHTEGLSEMLQELESNQVEAPGWLSFVGGVMLSVSTWISSVFGKLASPHLKLTREDRIAAFTTVSDWIHSPVRAFAWHPHVAKFAVAWQDDSVKVHTLNSNTVPLLKHKHQRAVACLAWRPLSASVLAVGCDTGLLIWTIDPSSPVTRLGSSSARHLCISGHSPVTSICWSPSGQLLVSGSPDDGSLMVWDIAMETATPLYRAGGGVILTCWSPDEQKLFAATPSQMFRVWETQTWTCEKWSNLAGRCQAACWSPDGSLLVFAVAHEPALYSLHFHETGDHGMKVNAAEGSQLATKCASLTEHTWDVGVDECVTAGGSVSSMEWDPHGERLAVIFQDLESHAQELVAVFRTRLTPSFEIMPCGFIRGQPGITPEIVTFQKNFDKGALLTVCWSDGSITFYPFLFMPSSLITENQQQTDRHTNEHVPTNGQAHPVRNVSSGGIA